MKFNSKLLTAAKLPQHHSSDFRGLGIVVEWPKGSVRVGEDKDGKKWHRTMEADYGYIPDTAGAGDKEGLDVYIGPDAESDKAYVVEQLKDDGKFDEYKVMLGFPDLDTAYETYLKHYPEGWGDKNVGEVSEVPFSDVIAGVKEHQEKTAAAKLPQYLYHGSPRVHMEDNLAHGLQIKNSVSHNEWDGGAIYSALDQGSAEMYPDHIEPGETHDKVVYRISTSYLNEQDLRPDDADFPDVFANLTEEEIEDAKARFGDDFDEDSWAYCDWSVSLYLSGQVAYTADIPPQALKVVSNKTAANGADAALERYFNPTNGMATPPPVQGYVWISPGNNDDRLLKGNFSDHWKFQDPRLTKHPVTPKQYDGSPRGYAEVKNDSKVVILSLSPNVKPDFALIPDSLVREFQQQFPGYKIYKNGAKTAGLAYLKALQSMTS